MSAPANERSSSQTDGPSAPILVVDDYGPNLLALEATLSPLGQPVVTAPSGAEALRRLAEREFAVVLLDVSMPRMDGFATAALIRRHAHFVPILFLTAHGRDSGYATEAYRHGAADYIERPADPDVLRAKVSVFVELHLRGERLKRKERALREEERARAQEVAAREAAEATSHAKDDFLAMVSHELRTPLNAILGWAELLRTGQLDESRRRHAVETIARCARAQGQLVEDLLDLSRIVAGKLSIVRTPVRLDAVVQGAVDAVKPIAAAKQILIDAEVPASADGFVGDAQRLQQVVWNLLTNAVKFSPAGSRVSVRLAVLARAYEIVVRDAGEGIATEFLPHVFERFRQADGQSTRRHGGLGLGLAIVRHIVEVHGGSVEAQSDGPGRGATFIVRLPRVRASAAPVEPLSTDDTAPIAVNPLQAAGGTDGSALLGTRVLVVDDEPDARDLVAAVLGGAGANVVTAASVDEALAIVRRDSIELVVSDLAMPGRDGYALARALRVERPGLPLVALSAFSSSEDRDRALGAGFVMHVAKPCPPDSLLSLLARLSPRRRPSRRATG